LQGFLSLTGNFPIAVWLNSLIKSRVIGNQPKASKERNYRLAVMREESDNPQLDLFDGKFKYRCILTNDHESSEKSVIEYYSQRGESEKLFDIQNNDFGGRACRLRK
jgi:hypothetical protein